MPGNSSLWIWSCINQIMKTKIYALVVTSVILIGSLNAFATGDCSGAACGLSCAPAVKHGNITATDEVLKQLTAGELKDAVKFNELVKATQILTEDKRMDAYLNMVGVSGDSELVQFVSERTIDSKYIGALSMRADLNDAQARLVINKISSALLGTMK
jgi:hypothetical protein